MSVNWGSTVILYTHTHTCKLWQYLLPSAPVDIKYPGIMDSLVALVPTTSDQKLGVGLGGEEAGRVTIPSHGRGDTRVTTLTQLCPVLVC